jgi:hypothetical protein
MVFNNILKFVDSSMSDKKIFVRVLWFFLSLLPILLLLGCQITKPHDIQIVTDPPAHIAIDGNNIGDAPIQIKIKPGVFEVRATLDGYETQLMTINIGIDESISPLFIQMPIILPLMPSISENMHIQNIENTWYQGLSADNKWIAVEGTLFGNSNIWVSDTRNLQWIPLVNKDIPVQKGAYEADWSPDGKFLGITLPDGSIRIFQTGQWNDPFASYDNFIGHRSSRLSWSPDSKRFAISALSDTSYIWLCDLVGNCEPILSSTEWNPMPEGPGHIIWSPNGEQILFIITDGTYLQFQNSQVWMIDVKTHKNLMMFETKYFIDYPEWSPDGRMIAFRGWSDKSVYIYNVQNGRLKTALGEGSKNNLNRYGKYEIYSSYYWSPDSQSLAFKYGLALYILKLSDGQVRQIALGNLYIERWTSDCESLIVRDEYDTIGYFSVR